MADRSINPMESIAVSGITILVIIGLWTGFFLVSKLITPEKEPKESTVVTSGIPEYGGEIKDSENITDSTTTIVTINGYTYYQWTGRFNKTGYAAPTPETIKRCMKESK